MSETVKVIIKVIIVVAFYLLGLVTGIGSGLEALAGSLR